MPDLRLMHASMQFSDTRANHRHDASAVFKYAKANDVVFLTGTEGGGDSLSAALTDAAATSGFALNLHRSGDWVAVNIAMAKVTSRGHAGPFVPGTTGLKASQGGHAPRGITWTTAAVYGNSTVTVGSVHYLTKRSVLATGVNNDRIAVGIGKWGQAKGAGKNLVFINGDMNMDDAKRDVFMGKPFTSCWDELKKWPATHGVSKARGSTIDVSASYDRDGRVSAKSAKVLDDSDLRLATDHFPLVAVYAVRP